MILDHHHKIMTNYLQSKFQHNKLPFLKYMTKQHYTVVHADKVLSCRYITLTCFFYGALERRTIRQRPQRVTHHCLAHNHLQPDNRSERLTGARLSLRAPSVPSVE